MLSLGLCVTLAWAIGLTCLWRAANHLRKMSALEPPAAGRLTWSDGFQPSQN